MRRRLLEVCLLAYPRARRESDGDYLRDLALELADVHGVWRQALSLLRGGLSERTAWQKRFVIVGSALAVMAFVAIGVVGPGPAGGERVEADRFACLDDVPGGCAETKDLVAARLRGGWDCASQRITRDGQSVTAWRCDL